MSDVVAAFAHLTAVLDRQIAAVTVRLDAGMQAWDKITVSEAVRRIRGLQRIQRQLAKLQLEWESLAVDGPAAAQQPPDMATQTLTDE
jgi:hypothetical protein